MFYLQKKYINENTASFYVVVDCSSSGLTGEFTWATVTCNAFAFAYLLFASQSKNVAL